MKPHLTCGVHAESMEEAATLLTSPGSTALFARLNKTGLNCQLEKLNKNSLNGLRPVK